MNILFQTHRATLPLANARDKRTQILWGLQDYRHRYGHDAHGMWLAETAVDIESLDIMAQCGITYTVLAPWQAATGIDCTELQVARSWRTHLSGADLYKQLPAVSTDLLPPVELV